MDNIRVTQEKFEDRKVTIHFTKEKIELKYGIEFSDREFAKWAHDFVDNADEKTQIEILCAEPGLIDTFEIPNRIWLELLEKKIGLSKHLKKDSRIKKDLLEQVRETKERRRKTKEAFGARLSEFSIEKRKTYVRIE